MSNAFETKLEQPVPDGRAAGEMLCEQRDCWRQAATWCPLCDKLLCQEHDELVAQRMHDCLSGPAE